MTHKLQVFNKLLARTIQRGRILKRVEEGEVYKAIAADEGVCVDTVSKIAINGGLRRRQRCQEKPATAFQV